jgi:hypothetical protein
MGTKQSYGKAIVDLLGPASGSDSESENMKLIASGVEKMRVDEMEALSKVLHSTASNFEARISAAAEHGTAKKVAKYIEPKDYPTLNRSNQGGEAEEQIDDIGGIGEKLLEAWQFGNIGLTKRYIRCLEKICSNVKGVIKDQLYNNLT